ncbi:hypothetical protein N7468_003927 [Penicillium chermesinum]|uniref:Uncharacterized protein n=1 Tax=Penicillium chermesinum TaxID=63820 RepID=A0A9W9P9W7_9EURO|nr:uncharacterized protein N7468_003927 [Penicillium chermesinum]KAJ5239308.1 hypothetical protein N7468_003927 [Penicillium chermesinum]KAJ6164936.1 hypothetical protein N7470_003608 [Penicillium chermesinum]
MNSLFRLPSRLSPPSSALGRNVTNASAQRTLVQYTHHKFAQVDEHDPDEKCERTNSPNHPIPSNNAHPTLRDGRQSNLANMAGVKHEDLPEDVRKHNEEMEHRYDRPYNHIGDGGKIEHAFEEK